MPRIPDDEIERIKQTADLAALVRGHGIELKPHGSGDLIGRCPFHDDRKTPNLIISPDKGLFHCLACGAAGSAIDLVMKLDGLDFREAVEALSGETQKENKAPLTESSLQLTPERAAALMDRAMGIYEKHFTESEAARVYLENRGICDAGLIAQHRIGYAAGTLSQLIPPGGKLRKEVEALGLLNAKDHERFQGCLVFPVLDEAGGYTTLYGRKITENKVRHLYLPDLPTGLWNAREMCDHTELYVVESVIDALSLLMAGIKNVISAQGTNGIGAADLERLRTEGVSRLVLLFDGDVAGQKAAERLKEKIEACHAIGVVEIRKLPEGKDPNDLLQEHGAEGLRNWILGSAPAVETEVDGLHFAYGLRKYQILGLDKSRQKLRATVRVDHQGKLHVDSLDLYSARARRTLCQDLCRIFDEIPETIEADLNKLLVQLEKQSESNPAEAGLRSAQPTLTGPERSEAEALGKSPDLPAQILSDYRACGLIGEEANKLLAYLVTISRKTSEPLALLILSSSGAGKTALQDAALAFVPPEDQLKLTSLSGKALFYKEREALKHKVLALEEGAGAEDASYAIRNLISAGELVTESTIKDLGTGRLTTMENRVEGPTAVMLTTTQPDTDPETKSRFFVTAVDESREQTRAILEAQRKAFTLAGVQGNHAVDTIRKRHQNFQRLLQPLDVVNPYADQLAYGDDRLQGRRDHPKYLNLIKTVTFLHQLQREVKTTPGPDGQTIRYIETTSGDIDIANRLTRDLFGHCLDELSHPSRNLLGELEKFVTKQEAASFTRREIRQHTGWSNYRVHTHLKELIDLEYLACELDRPGGGHRYRLLYNGEGKDGELFVLGLREVSDLTEPAER
jgi:DNA primase